MSDGMAPISRGAQIKAMPRRAPPTVHRPVAPNRSIPGLAVAKPISSSQPRTYSQPVNQQRYNTKPTQPRSFTQPSPALAQPYKQPAQSQTYRPKASPQRAVTRLASSSAPVQYNTGSATSGTIKQWAERQQYLDIYQINAFYTGTAQRSQYFMSFWKTATCFALQFIGIILLMQDQWALYQASSGGGCSGPKGSVAFIGYLFATYITMLCTEQIRTLNRYGMYGWGEQQPDFVNPMWVGVGLWVNTISLALSWIVSCIIIFTSGDLLNMVLNSVAVTFMLTLDDEIVFDSDYDRIVQWDGGNNTACAGINVLYRKIGALLLKIHPLWQRRIVYRGTVYECCDLVLCPGMILVPVIVLFCYPEEDLICLYEDESLCV